MGLRPDVAQPTLHTTSHVQDSSEKPPIDKAHQQDLVSPKNLN